MVGDQAELQPALAFVIEPLSLWIRDAGKPAHVIDMVEVKTELVIIATATSISFFIRDGYSDVLQASHLVA